MNQLQPMRTKGKKTSGRSPTRGAPFPEEGLNRAHRPRRLLQQKRPSEYMYDPVANGIPRQVGDRVQSQFAHQVCAVSFGGLDAEGEGFGDLFTGFSFGQQLDYLTLARCKRISGSILVPADRAWVTGLAI